MKWMEGSNNFSQTLHTLMITALNKYRPVRIDFCDFGGYMDNNIEYDCHMIN